MKSIKRRLGCAATSLIFLLSASCTQNPNTFFTNPSTATIASLVPRPSDPGTERAQLQRFRGQTEFLNPVLRWGGCRSEQPCHQEQEAAKDETRAEQESDAFKIGKPGSKLLYLLNNYRGLQVISFEDGPEKPKILGRVKATGNYPDEMYYDAGRERILVIERWASLRDSDSYEYQSRLISYDVSNASHPRMESIKILKGSVSDSRIVGDVLYIASTQDEKGLITSYSLKSPTLAEVESYQLPLRMSYNNSMNIVTIEKDGKLSYFLIATLSDSGWGWWDRTNVVQVVDITNPKGKIHTVMSVAARGFLRERSQTTIKNNTLIVTSNYTIDENSRLARIAVETFRFPTEQSEKLSQSEAQYRKLHIDRELKGKYGAEKDALFEKLINDPKIGIKGRFVNADGDLRKMMPDSAVTVGDGSGLSANLQDVRYKDGYLYAFWVPANEIDPFDIFDISDPEAGVKYISRLHFDGWIERAIPMSFQGRNFVLGLGRIVEPVNNDSQRRRPQAMIFEIVNSGGKMRAFDVAQYTFQGSDIWTNYNDDDKMIEVRDNGNGIGEILFPASKYSEQTYSQGGQILSYDLNKVVQNQNADALKPGAFLSGGSTWARRIFTNTEIGRINSFSDQALAVFGAGSVTSPGTLQPAHILELARNIRGYETLTSSGKTFGVQIINDYSWAEAEDTTLRSVAGDKADTEKSGILSEVSVPGSYVSHLREKKSGDLLLLTQTYTDQRANTIHRFTVSAAGELQKIGDVSWNLEDRNRRDQGYYYENTSKALLQLLDGTVLAQTNAVIKVLDMAGSLTVRDLVLSGCRTEEQNEVQVKVIGDRAYLNTKEYIESKDYLGLEFTRNWLSPMTLTAQNAVCSARLNIPGEAILVTSTGEILTEDTVVQDIVKEKRPDSQLPTNVPDLDEPETYHYSFLTKEALISLKVKDQKASLVDEASGSNDRSYVQQVSDNEFVRLVRNENRGAEQLEFLKLGADADITTDVYSFRSDLSHGVLTKVVADPRKAGNWLGVIQDFNKVQVIGWSDSDRHPSIVPITPVNEKMAKLKPVTSLPLQGSHWYYWGDSTAPHFTQSQMSFEMPLNLTGIEQFFIEN